MTLLTDNYLEKFADEFLTKEQKNKYLEGMLDE